LALMGLTCCPAMIQLLSFRSKVVRVRVFQISGDALVVVALF
jgi:hypothetical protein